MNYPVLAPKSLWVSKLIPFLKGLMVQLHLPELVGKATRTSHIRCEEPWFSMTTVAAILAVVKLHRSKYKLDDRALARPEIRLLQSCCQYSIFIHFHPFSANWLVDDAYGLLVRRFSQIETSHLSFGDFPCLIPEAQGPNSPDKSTRQ